MLRKLVGSQDPMFFEGLKMRLLAMDDEEFAQWTVFSSGEWQRVIDNCVATADTKIQKLIEKSHGQPGGRLVPFKKRNSDELEMKTVADLLSNLHKKSLRTRKINP
jgi:predicted pyridoxine 5'-phosphate oxidase superfamily flavin-nucleotide-binding protein